MSSLIKTLSEKKNCEVQRKKRNVNKSNRLDFIVILVTMLNNDNNYNKLVCNINPNRNLNILTSLNVKQFKLVNG